MKNLALEESKNIHDKWKSTGISIRDYCHNTGLRGRQILLYQQ